MRNVLIIMLLALAAGIACTRWVEFQATDFLWTLLLLCILAYVAYRYSARLLMICCITLILFVGACLGFLHRPGKTPQLDTGARETVLLEGCVVSPPEFSEDRDQFVLELAPKARVRVSLLVRDGELPPDLRYGQ